MAVQEQDPTGRGQHEAGAKVDAGKPRCDLVLGAFYDSLLAVADVGTFGAAKYSDNGWQQVPQGAERYASAMLRHYFKSKKEYADEDSGLSHLAHMAWCALAVLHFEIEERNRDTHVAETFGPDFQITLPREGRE